VLTYAPHSERYFRDGYFHKAEFVLEDAF